MTAAHVSFVAFQTDDMHGQTPEQGLTIALYDADADVTLSGVPLWSTTLPQTSVGFSPRTFSLPTGGVPLTAQVNGHPHHYALVLSTAATQGAYGTARSDGTFDIDPGFSAVQRLDASTSTWGAWAPDSTTMPMDLRYGLSAT
jgi:hypothetical protein